MHAYNTVTAHTVLVQVLRLQDGFVAARTVLLQTLLSVQFVMESVDR